jgi:hypothetical protein
MRNQSGLWWLPGTLVGLLGVLALLSGLVTVGMDRVDGVIFGSVALAAAAVILWRRAPGRSDSSDPPL